MRFINAETYVFIKGAVEEYQNDSVPNMIIGEELTYQKFQNLDKAQLLRSINAQAPGVGLEKILKSCAIARSKNIQHLWVDTCCIDKSDKVELDESLNSMFDWHRQVKGLLYFLI